MGRVSLRILAAMLLISVACRDRPAADQPGPAEDAAVLAVDTAFGTALNVHLTFGVDRFEIRDDRAFVVGHYRIETRPKSAEVPALAPEAGKFLEVLKRRSDGSWSYLVDMFSPNAPPK